MNAFLNEHISGMTVVKLFGREGAAAARFDGINDEHRRVAVHCA